MVCAALDIYFNQHKTEKMKLIHASGDSENVSSLLYIIVPIFLASFVSTKAIVL